MWWLCSYMLNLRSPEFIEMRRKAREESKAEILRRKQAFEALPHHEKEEIKLKKSHALVRDRRTKVWMVRMPRPNGGYERLSTGELDAQAAIKMVDSQGIQKLSILARNKCLTADVAQVLIAGHSATCRDIIEAWYRDMKMDAAPFTASSYRTHVTKLLLHWGCMNKPLNVLERQHIYAFVNDETVKESTRKMRLSAIRSLYRHAAGFGHVIGNISETVKVNTRLMTVEQRNKVPAIPFTESEYRRIMVHPMTSQYWRWACALAYWLGFRMVDVATLEVATLGTDKAVLYPRKTGRRLEMPINDPLIGSGELLAVFNEIRASLEPGQIYCFPKRREKYPFYYSKHYTREFKELMGHVGIIGKTFHGFRHSFKLRMDRSGKPLSEICALMGHSSEWITQGYGRGEQQSLGNNQ